MIMIFITNFTSDESVAEYFFSLSFPFICRKLFDTKLIFTEGLSISQADT